MAGDREVLREIEPTRAHELLSQEDGPILVDIRERSEWETGWIADALKIPMSELGDQLAEHRERPSSSTARTGTARCGSPTP